MGTELSQVLDRLDRIEAALRSLHGQQNGKSWYTTEEFAAIVGRSGFTVREWCRYRRIRAVKAACGRGISKEWRIPAEELERFQNAGLLPLAENAS